MPQSAPRICPRCRGRRDQCQCPRPDSRSPDTLRPSSHQRGYDHCWRRAREYHLARFPICQSCQDAIATEVDHIDPHRGDQAKFWNPNNWQSLCKPCHSRKTARGG
ncbi:MAG: HNH endonuclease signature motif containing protein [Planctomycetota bacterium]